MPENRKAKEMGCQLGLEGYLAQVESSWVHEGYQWAKTLSY